ncbi:hypothetical protein BN8_p06808 (plasmid) [Fibrisoma limi BUZ 3]|uniref:Uncharacterized protein n=1 Tax=Fibrisoma limi BUZ 3 TaxID=1185876 RepID=I2GU11_9BACT|nr:hypothetical protein [Fibrisoma limi]CCH57612.1 hypothetical protein BN8_p06808 [Fibrisoma limi BUZ 3]
MNPSFDTEWATGARLTFDRLPVDVQAGFLKQLPALVAKYAIIYEQKPADSVSVGTISHMQVPEWSMWLRMDTDYTIDEAGPILYINELEELTQAEVNASIANVHQRGGIINPTLE